MLGIVASARIQRISYQRLAQMFSAILLRSDGQWTVIDHDGEIFLADNTDSQSFRRLRLRLRLPM